MEGKNSGAPESTARAPPHPPLSVPAGNVMFSILCHASQVGSVIGCKGSVITQLKESTKSSILFENGPPGSEYSVIRIIAEVGSTSSVKLGDQDEEIEVSRAQHALIRVFEAVNAYHPARTVLCRLLMEASYVDAVVGEGGNLIERIKKETGCNVDIVHDDFPDDVVVKVRTHS